MDIFQKHIVVAKEDLDELDHVNNVRYVQWVNDIAKSHWEAYASPKILNGYYWVLLEHHLQYKGPAILNDELSLKTYVTRMEGVKSNRIVEIYNAKTSKLLLRSESIWCLISRQNDRPARMPQELIALFN